MFGPEIQPILADGLVGPDVQIGQCVEVVGFGQATLAGVMELIRSINGAMKALGDTPTNQATDVEIMRRFLAATNFEPTPEK